MLVEIIIKKVPKSCHNCKFLSISSYRVHNEIGVESNCFLGYMDGEDMRDINYRSGQHKGILHPSCKLEKNKKIKLI